MLSKENSIFVKMRMPSLKSKIQYSIFQRVIFILGYRLSRLRIDIAFLIMYAE